MRRERSIASRAWSLVASPRIAAWLMAVLGLVTLLGVLVPQESYMPAEQMSDFRDSVPWLVAGLESVGLTAVFSGWLFGVLAAALGVNVSACTIRRVMRHVRGQGTSRDHDIDITERRIAQRFEEDGWRVVSAGGAHVRATAGSKGFWGSFVLHVGILFVIVGGGLSVLTSFQGEMVIAEGQTVTDEPAAYVVRGDEPVLGDAYTGTLLRLDSMSVKYSQGEQVAVVARMSAEDRTGRFITQDVRVNRPLEVAGTSYLLLDSGYAPALVMNGPQGRSEQVVNLANETEGGWTDVIDLGELRSGGGSAVADMLAQPVPLAQGVALPTEKFDLENPRLLLRVTDDMGVLWEGELYPGQGAELTNEHTLVFEQLLLWNRYMVRRAPARWVVYVGFWLCIAGIAWRLAMPERRITVRWSGGAPRITYRQWPIPSRSSVSDEELARSIESMVRQDVNEV